MWNLGEDVETHPGQGIGQLMKPGLRSTTPFVVSIASDRVLDHGHEGAVVELEIVVRRPRQHVADDAERAATLLLDPQPDDLEVVELALGQSGQRGARDRQDRPAVDRAIEPDRPGGHGRHAARA